MEPLKDSLILVSVWDVCLCLCDDVLMAVKYVSVPIIEASYELPKFGRVCVVCDATQVVVATVVVVSIWQFVRD